MTTPFRARLWVGIPQCTNSRRPVCAPGLHAYVLDIQSGDALPLDFLQNVAPLFKEQENLSLVEKAKNAAVVPARIDPWLIRHRDSVTRPLIEGFLDAVRKIPGTGKVGAIGFCWGGRYAILLAHGPSPDEDKICSEVVDAAVACHPSGVSIPDDLEPVTKPLSIALGSKDSLVDVSSAGTIEDILDAKKEVPHQIQNYEDQVHGFALRSDWSSDRDKKSMDDFEKQGIAWFEKYLS